MKIWKKLMTLDKKKRITIIFIIVAISAAIYLPYDLFFSYAYKWFGERHSDPLEYFLYWTQLSNLFALAWISLLFFALVGKKEKLEFNLDRWNVRGVMLSFIITTGTVFMAVAFLPTIITYSRPGPYYINGEDFKTLTTAYKVFLIATTSLKHFVIPMLFLWEMFAGKMSTTGNKEMTNFQKSLQTMIYPMAYFTFVILVLTLDSNTYPPYPVFWFASTNTANDPNIYSIIIAFLSIIAEFIVVIFYSGLLFLILRLNDKKDKV